MLSHVGGDMLGVYFREECPDHHHARLQGCCACPQNWRLPFKSSAVESSLYLPSAACRVNELIQGS
eukprot:2812186-Amphidinium_carterae.1